MLLGVYQMHLTLKVDVLTACFSYVSEKVFLNALVFMSTYKYISLSAS